MFKKLNLDTRTLDLSLEPKGRKDIQAGQISQGGSINQKEVSQDGQERVGKSSLRGQNEKPQKEETSSDHCTSDSDTDSDTNRMFVDPKPGPSKNKVFLIILNF